MKAKITKIQKETDRFGHPIVIICLKGEDGHSYKTWTGKQFNNYIRWFSAMDKFLSNIKREIWLNGLNLKGKNLVDADSFFSIEIKETLEKAPI